jgi:hypothetical protein
MYHENLEASLQANQLLITPRVSTLNTAAEVTRHKNTAEFCPQGVYVPNWQHNQPALKYDLSVPEHLSAAILFVQEMKNDIKNAADILTVLKKKADEMANAAGAIVPAVSSQSVSGASAANTTITLTNLNNGQYNLTLSFTGSAAYIVDSFAGVVNSVVNNLSALTISSAAPNANNGTLTAYQQVTGSANNNNNGSTVANANNQTPSDLFAQHLGL